MPLDIETFQNSATRRPSRLELRYANAAARARPDVLPAPTQSQEELATPAIPEYLDKLAKADVTELSCLIGQLNGLRLEEPEDDDGALRLEEAAFTRASELLINATIVLATKHKTKMPYGCASTDSEGGLRIEWFRGDISMHLVIRAASAGGKLYFFHKVRAEYAVENEVSAETLAIWLSQVGD